jgi:flagellar motor switch protein FliN
VRVEQEIEYEQFGEAETRLLGASEVDLSRVSDIPMELSVEIGRTQMTVGETLSLRAGTIITLDRLAGEPVDLLVNGTPIARGEVVVVDEKFGLRVKEIVEGAEQPGQVGERRANGDAGNGRSLSGTAPGQIGAQGAMPDLPDAPAARVSNPENTVPLEARVSSADVADAVDAQASTRDTGEPPDAQAPAPEPADQPQSASGSSSVESKAAVSTEA